MQVAYVLFEGAPKTRSPGTRDGPGEGNGLPTTPSQEPGAKAQGTRSPAAAEGDIRRGGWILVLAGVILVLVAVVLVILY